MQGLIQQLSLLAAQANETDEERADRLTEAAGSAGVDPETLYLVECDVRGFGQHAAQQHPEKVEQIQQLASGYAPMLGMDPEQAGDLASIDTALSLLGQYATAKPDVTAYVVRALHESFERRGLYNELGTEAPAPGELQPPIDVVAGEIGTTAEGE